MICGVSIPATLPPECDNVCDIPEQKNAMTFEKIKNQVRHSVTPFDLLTDIGLDTDCDLTFRFCERIRERLVINESRGTNDTPKNNGKRIRDLRVAHGGGDAGPA